MPRIVSIDYGLARTGIAVTDSLQIISGGLTTIPSNRIISFLKDYIPAENVEAIVVGDPKTLNNLPNDISEKVGSIIQLIKKNFPSIPVYRIDERFTSAMASKAMIEGGLKKQKRRDKSIIDRVSAALILQYFMELKKAGRLPEPI